MLKKIKKDQNKGKISENLSGFKTLPKSRKVYFQSKNFKNIKGLSGTFQKEFKVYERENKNCLQRNCRGIIKRIIISNRSTFLCNYCQK